MGYTHFDRVSAQRGFAIGRSRSEVEVIDVNRKVNASSLSLGGVDVTATAAQLNSIRSFLIVQAHKSSVPVSQSAVEIFEFTAPAALVLSAVQVYCTAVAATATVDVREAGTTVLSSAVTPVAGSVVTGTITDSAIASGAAVTVHVTTNASGTITDLTVTLVCRALHVT